MPSIQYHNYFVNQFSTCVLLLIASCFFLTGCSREEELARYGCTGLLYLDGMPVPEARLRFAPDVSKGNSGPHSFSFVKNGEFKLADNHGLVEGPYQVEITIKGESAKTVRSASTPLLVSPDQENVFTVELTSDDLKQVTNEEEIEVVQEDGEG